MALKITEEDMNLCDHCLGRIYGMLGHGLSNRERGRALRVLYAMEHNVPVSSLYPEKCSLCGGIFDNLDAYAEYVCQLLKEYEFDTFLVGSRFPKEVMELEQEIHESHIPEAGESISREFNRELGKLLSKMLGKEGELSSPDMAIIVDTEYDDVRLEIKPLFLYGRYRKLVRGLPQTKWPSGKYTSSVEELIAKPVMELTGGEGHALHGMGREDIDVRMLGRGRPFVLEISRPRKRHIDLKELQKRINEYAAGKVEVLELRESSRKEVRRIKSAKPRKLYRIAIRVDAGESEMQQAIAAITGKIRQRTPKRVAHRRADKIRVRTVHSVKIVEHSGALWVLDILAESGTYIKELMHGDGGRTTPSLAEALEKEVNVEYLDVLDILDEEEKITH